MGLKRFDYRIKDNRKKKSIIAASIIVLVLLVGITIYVTFASYKVTKSYNIIQGQVGTFTNADLSVAIKLVNADGSETVAADFPSYLEYAYDTTNSTCKNGSTITFDDSKWQATISASTKDKCTLYFEQRSTNSLAAAILTANGGESSITELTSTDFATPIGAGEAGLYKAADDDGTSYYFRGAVDTNYIKFGKNSDSIDMFWRIVRINGDGSIRLIYDGVYDMDGEAKAYGTPHVASITTMFYGMTVGDPYYKNNYPKIELDTWYGNNLKKYNNFIVDTTFCNDTQVVSETNGWYTYAGSERVQNANPTLECAQTSDRLTVASGDLNYPIGLITADEAMMAGSIYETENLYLYLSTGEDTDSIWTMTPDTMPADTLVNQHHLTGKGSLSSTGASSESLGLRPVINIDANIKMFGSGTYDDPYRLTK